MAGESSRRRRWGAGLLILALAGIGAYWLTAWAKPDPKAIEARELVEELSPRGRGNSETVDELVRLGPEAAPYLTQILKAQDTKIDALYDSFREKAPEWIGSVLPERTSKDDLRRRLAYSVRDMGPMVRCLVTGTTRALELSNDPGLSRELLRSLYWSIPESPEATQALRDWLANPEPERYLFGMSDAAAIWPRVPELAPLLIEWLKLPDQAGAAAEALGLMGTNAVEAVPHLVDVYRNGVAGEDPNLELAHGYADRMQPIVANRRDAVDALGRIGQVTPEVQEVLGEALSHTNKQVRASAANAIGHLGKKGLPLLPSLLENLDDGNEQVLEYQLAAIGRMGPGASNAIPVLAQWARPQEHDVTMPEGGAVGYSYSRPRYVQIPRLALSDGLPSIPVAAALSLWRVDPDVGADYADVLAEGLTDHIPYSALDELKPLRDELIPQVVDALRKESGAKRLTLAFRVLSLDPSHAEARRELRQAMQSGDSSTKAVAACYFYVGTGETEGVLQALEEALEAVRENNDQTPVRSVGWLGEAGKPLVPQIRPLLKSGNEFVRSSAGKALRAIDPTALPPIDGDSAREMD